MTSFTKKLTVAFLAVIAAVCLALGTLFTFDFAAADTAYGIELTAEEYGDYFDIEGGVFKGLKNKSETETVASLLGTKKYRLVIPESVTGIAAGTSSGSAYTSILASPNNLVSLQLPQSLKTIGNYAFASCTGLTSITIPANVTSIGVRAFSGCSSVTQINYHAIEASTTSEISPFSGIGSATVNIEGTSEGDIKDLPQRLFYGTSITSVTFKNVYLSGISALGNYIFSSCASLKSVTFSDSCTISAISNAAFDSCSKLQEITLPNSVNRIEPNAFQGCNSLLTITIPSAVDKIGKDAFKDCNLYEVVNNSSYEIGSATDESGLKDAKNIVTKTSGTSKITTNNGFMFYDNTVLLRYTGTSSEITLPTSTTQYDINNYAFRGNSSITKVIIPSSVKQIGAGAFMQCDLLTTVEFAQSEITLGNSIFYGCSSLVNVRFEDDGKGYGGITVLGAQMFMNCISLKNITLPSTVYEIGGSAFEGCVKLEEVNFTPYENEGKDCYKIQNYKEAAFKGCTSLTSFTIHDVSPISNPSTAADIREEVFYGCSNLEKVYLPAAASFTSVNAFGGCSHNLLLIAPNKNAYADYAVNGTIQNIQNKKLTYEIKLILNNVAVEGTAPALAPVYRYFGITGQSVPAQDGYKTSVWYTTSSCTTKVNLDSLLSRETEQENLYAHYVEKPAVTNSKLSSLGYTGRNLLTNETLQKWFGPTTKIGMGSSYIYTVEIADYKPLSEVDDEEGMVNAGYYTLNIVINNADDYGEWSDNVVVETSVDPVVITDAAEEIEWGYVNGNSVTPLSGDEETLYNYGSKWYRDLQKDIQADREVTVSYSYVMRDGREKKVQLLKENSSTYFEVIGEYEGTVSATDGGEYFASVTIRMKNNYALPNDDPNYEGRGLSFVYSQTSHSYTITKIWYIVSSDANMLVSGGLTYSIEDWHYGESVTRPAPELLIDVEGYYAKELVFRLNLFESQASTEPLIDAIVFKYEQFSDFINSSMPAGYYALNVTIPTISTGGTEYEGGETTVFFTVGYADYNRLGLSRRDPVNGTSVSTDYTGEVTFGISPANMPILGLAESLIHPARTGTWADPAYDGFYTKFVIKFSYSNSAYLTEEEFKTANGPKGVNEYNGIKYIVSAPGYEPFEGSYHLHIMEAVNLPDLEKLNIVYENKSLVNSIRFDINSSYIGVVYLTTSNESISINGTSITPNNAITKLTALDKYKNVIKASTYENAGEYYVVLYLKDYANAKWSESAEKYDGYLANFFGTGGNAVVLKFNIQKAVNSTVKAPTVLSWSYGNFSKQVNEPQWQTKYNTDQQFYIVSADKNSTVTYWYEPGENQNGFDKAPAGEYLLYGIALENSNVLRYKTEDWENEWFTVVIDKAELYWEVTPHIKSWKYGNDDNITEPTGTLPDKYVGVMSTSDWFAYICKAADYGIATAKQYVSFSDLKNAKENAGHVPAGEWVYVFRLYESGNYKEWSYPIYFTVLAGDNYWEKAPVISDFVYGEYVDTLITTLDYRPHVGSKSNATWTFTAYDLEGALTMETNSSLQAFTVTGQLPAGIYKYTVTLASYTNYEGIVYNGSFTVKQSENGWENVPAVLSWEEGAFTRKDNTPYAKAQHGTVFYTIKTSSGEDIVGLTQLKYEDFEKDEVITLLRRLGAGSYKLYVQTDSNNNYKAITAEVNFVVFDNPTGMTALGAAALVFAVIATGLAVATIVVLIRKSNKNKKETHAESKRR